MRVRLLLVAAALLALMLATTGRAYADCWTPCAAGRNCIQMCFPVDLGDLLR